MELTVNQIQQAYIAFFNRPADPTGLAHWLTSSAATVEDLLGEFAGSPEYKAQYTGKTNAQIVDSIYLNLFGRGAETEGLFFWAGHLDSGALTVANVAWTILNSANDGAVYKDASSVANKAEAATAFTDYLAANAVAQAAYETGGDAAAKVAKDWLAAVGSSAASKDAAIAGIGSAASDIVDAATGGGADPGTPTPDDGTIYIGDRPVIEGTAANNTFKAGVGSIDDNTIIDGKGGTDTLDLTIGADGEGIAPTVLNVEKVIVRGQHVTKTGGSSGQDNNIADGATLDADRFDGAVRWWESNNSRTDVKIEDIRIADGLLTKDVTIAFVESDPGHVDYAVYFDQASLRNQGSSLSKIIATVYDYANDGITASDGTVYGPLTSNLFNVLNIRIDGELKAIAFADVKGANATYEDLLASVQAAIAASTDPLVKQLVVTLGGPIPLYNEIGNPTGHTAPHHLIIELANHNLTEGNWTAVGGTPASGGIDYYQKAGGVDSFSELVTSTVVLDYVGRGDRGGDLVIGSLSTGSTDTSIGVQQFDITVKRDSSLEVISSTNNSLQVVNIKNEGAAKYQGAFDRTPGVAREGDLTVKGDSQVATLVERLKGDQKTGPFETVDRQGQQYIDGATNAQYDGYGFTDVRVLDASAFKGQLNLSAILTQNVVGKYLTLRDGAPALANADNVTFNYDLGSNNDSLDLAISSANLAASGAANREDFRLTIKGEAGDDVISTAIYANTPVWGPGGGGFLSNNPGTSMGGGTLYGDGLILANATDNTPWYANSKSQQNLSIDGGTGNDTINTFGSGDWTITLDQGNDTYYADNTGAKAVWVFNTANQIAANANTDARWLGDLQTGNNANYRAIGNVASFSATDQASLYGLKLRVVFQDVAYSANTTEDAQGQGVFISKSIDVPTAANNKYIVTDLNINQAIKTAINSDPVLSKLLVATDGPANTLVVTALSDGRHVDVNDLQVEFAIPTTVAAADVDGYKAALNIASYATGWDAAALATARANAFNTLISGGATSAYDGYGVNPVAATAGYTAWTTVGTTGTGAVSTQASYHSAFAEGSNTNPTGGLIPSNADIAGVNSTHTSDNRIIVNGAATDHDVVVLSTGPNSNDTLVWNNTFNNGAVTVVNFEASTLVPPIPATSAVVTLDFGRPTDTLTANSIVNVVVGGAGTDSFNVNLNAGSAANGTLAQNGANFAAQLDALAALDGWTVNGSSFATDGRITLTRIATGDTTATATITAQTQADLSVVTPGAAATAGTQPVVVLTLGDIAGSLPLFDTAVIEIIFSGPLSSLGAVAGSLFGMSMASTVASQRAGIINILNGSLQTGWTASAGAGAGQINITGPASALDPTAGAAGNVTFSSMVGIPGDFGSAAAVNVNDPGDAAVIPGVAPTAAVANSVVLDFGNPDAYLADGDTVSITGFATGAPLIAGTTAGTGGDTVAANGAALLTQLQAEAVAGTLEIGGLGSGIADFWTVTGATFATDGKISIVETTPAGVAFGAVGGVISGTTTGAIGSGNVNIGETSTILDGTTAGFTPAVNAEIVLDFGDTTDTLTLGTTISVNIPGVTTTPIVLHAANTGALASNATALQAELAGQSALAGWNVSAYDATTGSFTLTPTGALAGSAIPGLGTPVITPSLATDLAGIATQPSSFTQGVAGGTGALNLGQDTLDFSAYGAVWLGAGVQDDTANHYVAAWDVDNVGLTTLPTWVTGAAGSAAPVPGQIRTGEKYITLTHVTDQTDGTVANPHQSTLYKVELWTVAGNAADAYQALATGDTRDTAQLIGYVDVGRVIENAGNSTDEVLDNILF